MQSHKSSLRSLDYFYNLVYRTIIHHQDQVTGLLPAHQIAGCEEHAWIRDNVYSITSVWALAMAYKRRDQDEDKARNFLLEKATVKCMRGILMAMMAQRQKVEKFKVSFSKKDALHAKYCSKTGRPVVADDEWGHLQIDAVSLYLLSLAQMTAGGLQIVFTLDEVAFVQNLVFYIECAYATPDYGVWERGAKSNQGILELNASSIGMAKAALESLNKLDLFGANGSPASVIHTLPDEAVRCTAVLESMLPRESNSKETDAAILGIIGYPAFAVTNSKIIEETLETLQSKLGGRYGMKRFLRDGYKTLKEDTGRLHYEPWELRVFDNIECEWPLFFCYLAINNVFSGNLERAFEYTEILDQLTVASSGMKLIPELYIVTEENMSKEYASPGTTERAAGGRCPFMWAQSLHVVSKLLQEDFLAPAELDPMNRRLSAIRKPDVCVQVVVLAEDTQVQMLLADQGIMLQTTKQISPIEVKPAGMLSHLYSFLGRSKKLGLSGRKNPDVGILTTSKIYRVQNKTFVFTPQSFDRSTNYIDTDPSLAMSTLAYGLNYLSTSWTSLGRPTLTLILSNSMLEDGIVPPPIVNALRKLAGGYISGTRVILGTHEQFKPTSCYSNLAFLGDIEDGNPERLDPQVVRYLETQLGTGSVKEGVLGKCMKKKPSSTVCNVTIPLTGSMKRSRSICPDMATSREISKHLADISAMELGEDLEEKSNKVPKFSIGGFNSRSRSESTSSANFSRQSSLADENIVLPTPATRRTRFESEVQYMDTEVEDLVDMLSETNDMEIHGDILHYMVVTYGMEFETGMGIVKDLLRELYESACVAKHWGIVRHTNGLLKKKIPNLALSLTDLIVRQKQVTVGLPPNNEIIISQPLGGSELRNLISKASEGDMSAATLTQEILTYLAMFIRTEPNLFHGMLRLRIGLILQVMASEMARTLGIPGEEATDKLLNLPPFETKNLLHHIMAGEEYGIDDTGSKISFITFSSKVSKKGASRKQSCYPVESANQRRMSSFPQTLDTLRSRHKSNESLGEPDQSVNSGSTGSLDQMADEESERTGMWMRRRLLDGSLNRVPPGFYTRMWSLLEKCQGISVHGKILSQSITQEMTSGEMKFHLRCEALLNTVPEPEFRQLVVESILILILCVEYNIAPYLGGIIIIDDIVRAANTLFLEDQAKQDGDATLCCTKNPGECDGEAGICVHFYDSAPSGTYGTMSYLVRATCKQLNSIPDDGAIDCTIM